MILFTANQRLYKKWTRHILLNFYKINLLFRRQNYIRFRRGRFKCPALVGHFFMPYCGDIYHNIGYNCNRKYIPNLRFALTHKKYYMKKIITVVLLLLFAVIFFNACKKESKVEEPVAVFAASGDINTTINEFRNLLGSQLNTTTGAVNGRREINWDGINDSLVGKALPNDFFNPVSPGAPVGRQRGLAYAASSGTFMVSNTNFANINAAAASQFKAFSGDKTFANISSNKWEVTFKVPGAVTDASVKGFGAVFSDVDLNNSTSLEFFNGTKSIGKYFVPPHDATNSFSFLGVYLKSTETITSVQVSHQGNLASGEADISNNGTADLIVLDDFLYNEPVAR